MKDERAAKADALMGELRRQAAGRLTVYLGAAPGVGKTYAMLTRAQELRKQGVDVVIGIVETHGRDETAALLAGLEVIPRKYVSYQGRVLEELDIDEVLRRKPQIVIVDELAHRNVPGSRHERRWQDVEELLDAGIDVYSAINVQHIESLNDIVHRITGIRVSETVPDSILDRLRDIRLVDLPPRELIERLNSGKVYLPAQAERALQAYFSPSNLAALRELAMQAAADRVDDDFRSAQFARGLPGIALRRRVLVAIGGLGSSEYLVRAGRRIAELRDAPWSVVTVQKPSSRDSARQAELNQAFALARSLGAETDLLYGPGVADALLNHAERSGASTLVLGRARERSFTSLFKGTITQQLLKRGAHYEFVIVGTPHKAERTTASPNFGANWLSRTEISLALSASALATLVAWAAEHWVVMSDLSMVFIVAVVLVAARTRMAAAGLSAVLCFLAYNFFFIAPRLTLFIGARQGVVTVVLFLATALVAGRMASRLRMQVLALKAANAHATALQELGTVLSSAADIGEILRSGRTSLERQLGVCAWLKVGLSIDQSEGVTLQGTDSAAADWVASHSQPAGRYTDTLAGSAWWFLPLRSEKSAIGVLGLKFSSSETRLPFEQRRLAEAMADAIAHAVVRAQLVADLEGARVSNESERLRSALLSSVSHDLRSPLTAMVGSASSLVNYGSAMSEEDRIELLETVLMEGERLDRYIQNLLDMTRLGHTGLSLNREWIGVDELIGSATGRFRRYQPSVKLSLNVAGELPPIWIHPALIEQALFNVLENAAKFSTSDEAIDVSARTNRDRLEIDVHDRGPGIPEEERSRIFDMFYTVERGDRGGHGTGLGLTIARGMIGAHGGKIEALAGPDGRGTLIRMTIPFLEPATSSGGNGAD